LGSILWWWGAQFPSIVGSEHLENATMGRIELKAISVHQEMGMLRHAALAILFLLTVLNVTALAINVSLPSWATTSYQKLIHNVNFTRAVKTIAEQCRVNVDLGKLQCGIAEAPGQR
jgi:hypothetical protein